MVGIGMQLLEERILRDGRALSEDVLLKGEIDCPNCGENLEFDFDDICCDDDCDCHHVHEDKCDCHEQ